MKMLVAEHRQAASSMYDGMQQIAVGLPVGSQHASKVSRRMFERKRLSFVRALKQASEVSLAGIYRRYKDGKKSIATRGAS